MRAPAASNQSSTTAQNVRALMYMFFPGGGIGRYTHELAEALHRLPDVDIDVACVREYEYLNEASYPTWPHLMSIHSKHPLYRRARFLGAQIISPRRAISHAIDTCTDILHLANINHLTFPIWRRWLKKSDSLRLAATVHDVRRSKSIINRSWETKNLQRFYESADALFIHSTQQKEDLLNFARVREEVIHQVPMGTMPYAVATATKSALRRRYNIPESRMVALFFGNIRDDKNLDGLLTAMSLLAEPIFLVIAGRAGGAGNKSDAWYRQRIWDLRLNEHVLFLDRFIENNEVGDLFSVCDFVPLCYLTSFTSQSAVLNVAMHYDRPVLASPAPTLAETVQEFQVGILADSDSPESLLLGIEKLTQKIASGTEFQFAEYKRRNSWHENARITRSVYQSLRDERGQA
jgi:glycosyltransferase involved in cell wall biosynthesis